MSDTKPTGATGSRIIDLYATAARLWPLRWQARIGGLIVPDPTAADQTVRRTWRHVGFAMTRSRAQALADRAYAEEASDV